MFSLLGSCKIRPLPQPTSWKNDLFSQGPSKIMFLVLFVFSLRSCSVIQGWHLWSWLWLCSYYNPPENRTLVWLDLDKVFSLFLDFCRYYSLYKRPTNPPQNIPAVPEISKKVPKTSPTSPPRYPKMTLTVSPLPLLLLLFKKPPTGIPKPTPRETEHETE